MSENKKLYTEGIEVIFIKDWKPYNIKKGSIGYFVQDKFLQIKDATTLFSHLLHRSQLIHYPRKDRFQRDSIYIGEEIKNLVVPLKLLY